MSRTHQDRPHKAGYLAGPSTKLYDVIFVINLFQVAPVSIIDGIAQVAARVLKPSGFLAIYGRSWSIRSYTTRVERGF